MKRPLIVWDVDDVLNNFTEQWALIAPPELAVGLPGVKQPVEDAVYLASFDTFRATSYASLRPRESVLEWLRLNAGGRNNIALSSAPLQFMHTSAEWTLRHYGAWIRGFICSPSRGSVPRRSKADILREDLKCDIFIDDQEANVDSAKGAVRAALLFPAPWNSERRTTEWEFLSRLNAAVKEVACDDKSV